MLLILQSLILLLIAHQYTNAAIQFRVVYEWNYINFTWMNEDQLQQASANGDYIPEHISATGITYHSDYLYVALPRRYGGVPATLARFRHETGDTSPLLEAYPSWPMNRLHDCHALQNVNDVEVDNDDNLWILDAGSKFCTPKLVIHNIVDNITRTIYNFPSSVAYQTSSLLYKLAIDGEYAYISDNEDYEPALIVFRSTTLESWRIVHDATMRAHTNIDPLFVNGIEVRRQLNIGGLALGKRLNANGDRILYFSSIGSHHLYEIDTNSLKNRQRAQDYFLDNVHDVGLRKSQSDGTIMDNKGILYYGLLNSSSINVWNSSKLFNITKTIARDPNLVQWTNSFAFDTTGGLFALTSQHYNYLNGAFDLNQINIRILHAYTASLSYTHDDGLRNDAAATQTTSSSSTTTTATENNHIHFVLVTTPSTTTISVRDEVEVSGGYVSVSANSCIALLVYLFALLRYVN